LGRGAPSLHNVYMSSFCQAKNDTPGGVAASQNFLKKIFKNAWLFSYSMR
jgi:hypothetical protein